MAKRVSKYHKVLKEFTKLNNNLPEDKKLSIKERREIIKNQVLPKYKDKPASKVKIKDIRNDFKIVIRNIPPKELCDLNYIDTSEYAYVEWYALDETISELVPDCVYVKVTAGDFGETKIVNTRNYEYSRNGVRAIVERIRPEAQNSSGRYIFSGFQKLRPRKKNNGNPENYYLDFVLFEIDSKGNEIPQGETESVRYDLPKTKETKKKKTKVKNIIEKKVKQLKQKRDSKKRAKSTLERNLKAFSKTIKKVEKAKKPTTTARAKELARKQFAKASQLIEKYYAEGKLTKPQYEKALERLFKEFNQ